MTQQEHKRVNDALTSARQAHGIGETTESILTNLQHALAVCISDNDASSANSYLATSNLASVHYSLATHYMLRNQLSVAIEHCESGLQLVGGSDTPLEIELLVLLSRQHLSNNVSKARELTTQAMSLSSKINGHTTSAVLLRHAEAVGADGDTEQAIALLREAEAMSELDNDSSGRLLALLRLCVQLNYAQRFGQMIEYATEAIALAKDLNRRMAHMNACKFLAMGLTAINKPAEAYEVARHALDIAEAHYPGHLVGDCTGVLGDVYLKLKDLPTALSCFARARNVYKESGHRNGVALCLLRMGEVYSITGQTAQAEQLLKEADEIADEIGNKIIKQSVAVVRAGLYMRDANVNHAPAKEAIDKAVDMFRLIASSTSVQQLPLLDELENAQIITREIENSKTRELENSRTRNQLLGSETAAGADSDKSSAHKRKHTEPLSIRVTMLGSFQVVRGDVEITLEEWKRKKARDVFKFLVARHRRSVSVDEIVLHVWGEDLDAERCLPTLQNAVSAIRTALEPGLKPRQKSQFIQFIDGSYIIDLGQQSMVNSQQSMVNGQWSMIDVEEFTQLAKHALTITDQQQRLDALTRAADLYTGDFLPDDTYYEWTDFIRSTTKELAIEVLDQLASAQFALGMDAAARITMHRSAALD